jgi:hypothetical protein
MQKAENDLNVELGYCYHSTAVIPEGDNGGREHENPRESKGRPGTRAPHLFVEQDGKKISTLDLFGRNFVLITGPEAYAWRDGAAAAGKQLDIPLDVHTIGTAEFLDAYDVTPSGAMLVRPDGFVAWRSKSGEDASAATLIRTLQVILKV